MRFRIVLVVSVTLLLRWFGGASAAAEEFGFAALEELIHERDIHSVDELIAALPADLRTHYALVFESRSLQGASFAAPRVIAYGPEAHFVLTFNGDPGQRGFQAVETLEFDSDKKEFRFRELEFPDHAPDAPPGASPDTPVIASPVNPKKCAGCHGVPAKPVWDTYPVWPGAYGERYGEKLSQEEVRGLALFLKRQPTDSRYRHLLEVDRFSNPETFHPTAKTFYSAAAPEPPNAELSLYLSRLEFQSVARSLARQPQFPAYQYALLGVVDNACGSLSEFYPEPLWRAHADSFERFVRDTRAANASQLQMKMLRLEPSARAAAAELVPDLTTLTKFRFVAESSLGVSGSDWSLALERATYDFTAPPARENLLREALLSEMAYTRANAHDADFSGNPSDGDRYCADLKHRSLRALTGVAEHTQEPVRDAEVRAPIQEVEVSAATSPPGQAAENIGGLGPPTHESELVATPPLAQVCVGCHQTDVAPRIPFTDPVQLAKELRTRPAAHGRLIDEVRFRLSAAAGAQRMPLGINLSEEQRQQLNAYFTALATAD